MSRLPLLICVLLSAVYPELSARAATIHCVNDEAQLRAALAALGGFASGDHEIRLVRRVYFNGTQQFSTLLGSNVNDLRLSGGWDSGCTAQMLDARATAIDAQGLSAVLSIGRNSAIVGTTPLISISNLTLRNGTAANAPVGLHVYNGFGSIEVDDVIVHGHRATASSYLGGTAITLDSTRHDIRLRNALVYDNEGMFITGTWALVDVLFTSMALNPDRQFAVTNTTIDAGTGAQDFALRLQSDGHFDLFNNVIRGEARFDMTITGAGAATAPRIRRLFNHMPIPVSNGVPVVDLETGNSTADPQLDPASFEPLPGSPVVNTGLGNPPGGQSTTDVYGRPRLAFTYIDRGAVEAQTYVPTVRVFGDGFE